MTQVFKFFIAVCMVVAMTVHVPLIALAQSSDENQKSEQKTKQSTGQTTEQDQSVSSKDLSSESEPVRANPKPHMADDIPVTGDNLEGVPLVIGGVEIVRFKGTISGFTPDQRVRAIKFRLHELEENPSFNINSITTKGTGFSTDIVAGNDTIFTITDRDARLVGQASREVLAGECATKLKQGLLKEQEAKSPKVIFMASVFTAVAFIVLMIALSILAAVFPWLYRRVESARGKYIASVKIQKAELLSEDSLTDILIGLCRIVRAFVTLILLTVFVEAVLSFYPTTRELSGQVTDKFMFPMLHLALSSITAYVPNLLIIITVIVCAYYLIGFTRFIFNEIGRGSITFSGFEQEWATPTYTIFRFLIIAFAIVLMFPYLPGSGSPAFQQVSIFLGVLISLGSSGAVSNVIAGVFLTYTGAFRLGDRVRIADTVGDVTERRLLYTRIRTIKDEFITIPNSLVLGSHIINYSASMQGNGLVLHTSVTIGYDVEWRMVENLLIEAAKATANVRDEPPPFVLVTSLDDFFVTHQINAFTSAPHSMAQTYADLHKNILDKFFEAGVEIMSPHVHSVRDGSDDAIPSKYRKEGVPKRPSMSPYARK
ncbi:MAG: mechanosensitive ion channel family protein [Cyanobacteria bacterium SZAS-4]|nr:mechanosensitive ion channel family protein [Cyanobacteria bacterium SZAS-4]